MSGVNVLHSMAAKIEPGPLMTVLIGIVVVFGVLLLLTFIFWLFGVIAGGGKKEKASASAPKAPAPVATPTAPVTVAAPVIADGVPQEVVAVIAAAIASMSGDGVQYAVRRIRPAAANASRPVWAAAGIAENTRPF